MRAVRDPQPDQPRLRRRRRRGLLHRLATLCLGLLLVPLLALALAGSLIVERPLDAPDWLRRAIEQRLAQELPQVQIDMGRMAVMIQRDGQSRLLLWDVEITDLEDHVLAQFSDVEAGFATGALLTGRPVLRAAQVSGAVLSATRDRQGQLALGLGVLFGAFDAAPDLASVIGRVDAALGDPRLARFDSFEADALTIRYDDQRARRIWTVDGGRLALSRSGDRVDLVGNVALLTGRAEAATLEVSASSRIGETALRFGVLLEGMDARDVATQSPGLAWLEALDAPISGALRSEVTEAGQLGALNAALRIGPGALAPNTATRPLPFDRLSTYLSFDPEAGRLVLNEVTLASPLGQLRGEGKAQVLTGQDGQARGLWAQVALSDIAVREGAITEKPLRLAGARMDFQLDLDPFRLTLGALDVLDKAYPLRATGRLEAERAGWNMALDARLPHSDLTRVLDSWPVAFRAKSRAWIAKHIQSAQLQDVSLSLRGAPSEKPVMYLEARVSGVTARIKDAMPAIEGGAGHLSIADDRLAVLLDAGHFAPEAAPPGQVIDLAGSSFVIPDLDARPETGEVQLRARGAMPALMGFLDAPEWRVFQRAGLASDSVSGQGLLQGTIRAPLVKALPLSQVTFDLTGRLENLSSRRLVPGLDLRAEALDLRVADHRVTLRGAGEVRGQPVTFRLSQPLGAPEGSAPAPGGIEADFTLTEGLLRAFDIAVPDGIVDGGAPAQFALDFAAGGGTGLPFRIDSTLTGAGLSLPHLGWRFPQARSGQLQVTGRLGKAAQAEVALDAGDLRLRATVDGTENGLGEIRLSEARLSGVMDLAGSLQGRGAGVLPGVRITSGWLDLRDWRRDGSGLTARPEAPDMPLDLRLSRVQLTDSLVLRDMRVTSEGRGGDGRFRALMGDSGSVLAGTIVGLAGGGQWITAQTDDAEALLGLMGLQGVVDGGDLTITMTPVADQPDAFDAELTVYNVRMQGAPAMAAVLDAISIVGLLDRLNGPGIFFSVVKAKMRITPDQITLVSASAEGPSMGVSLSGYYYPATHEMDLQGVVSPVYLLNVIGRALSRRDGEGLFGVNFALRGAYPNPRVSVNPLSALLPGGLRDLLSKARPTLADPD